VTAEDRREIDAERDLALAGSTIDGFAPAGILGFIAGAVTAAMILIMGHLRRVRART
jgi:hypothetical protein